MSEWNQLVWDQLIDYSNAPGVRTILMMTYHFAWQKINKNYPILFYALSIIKGILRCLKRSVVRHELGCVDFSNIRLRMKGNID